MFWDRSSHWLGTCPEVMDAYGSSCLYLPSRGANKSVPPSPPFPCGFRESSSGLHTCTIADSCCSGEDAFSVFIIARGGLVQTWGDVHYGVARMLYGFMMEGQHLLALWFLAPPTQTLSSLFKQLHAFFHARSLFSSDHRADTEEPLASPACFCSFGYSLAD